MVTVTVDGRETRVLAELDKQQVQYVRKELQNGDITFSKDDGSILLICERKTYPDLASSIASGRYAEQRERMKQCGAKMLYIIEGPHVLRNDLDRSRVLGAFENLFLTHEIPILPTASVSETATAIKNIKKKLESSGEAKQGTIATIVKRKAQIMDNILHHQLQVVPGVSSEVAKAITAKYANMQALLAAYTTLASEKEKELLLADVALSKRRLGPAVSKRIYQAHFGIGM